MTAREEAVSARRTVVTARRERLRDWAPFIVLIVLAIIYISPFIFQVVK